jgi:hypothetical protein
MQSTPGQHAAARIESLEQRSLLSVNILMHHGDLANDGANLAETVLTPADVNSADFGKRFSTTLGGRIFAQPLYVQDVNITRGSQAGVHSVLYVATMRDSLFALDASTGAILWQDNFLSTTDPTQSKATPGVTTIPADAIAGMNGVTDVGTEAGILGTPVIDLKQGSAGAIYLIAVTQEVVGAQTHFVQRLWSVSLANGSPLLAPTVIGDTISSGNFFSYGPYQYVSGPIVAGSGNNPTPTTYPNRDGWASAPGGATTPVIAFNAEIEKERSALTLLNGTIYVGFASYEDDGPYYGWLLGFNESTLALTTAFVTTPTYEGIVGDSNTFTAQGSIWQSGSAITTDGTYLYVTTGNGAFNTAASNFDSQGFPIDHDYANSLLKLQVDTTSSPTNQNGNGWGLKVADYFTPSNVNALNVVDLDMGAGGVLLLPNSFKDAAGNPMLMVGSKESRLYLVDRNNLGKFNLSYPSTGNPDPRNYDRVLAEYAGDGINGTANGIWSTPAYYSGQIYLAAYKTNALVFNVSSFASGTVPPGTTHVETPTQTGPVFDYPGATFTISANGTSNALAWAMDVGHADLLAFNAGNITKAIYDSNTVAADRYTKGVTFGVPTVANGMVYLGDAAGVVSGFGLRSSYLKSNKTFFSPPANLSASRTSSTTAHLTWTSHSSLASEYRIDRSTNGTTWNTIALVSNPSTSYDDAVGATTRYYYRVAAVSAGSVTAFSNTATLSGPRLTGTVIGTIGSYKNAGNTISKAVDGNLNTYFDGPSANGNWVGLDLGTAKMITQISFAPRANFASRMVGGIFQASNSANFSTGVVNLYKITTAPPTGVLTNVLVSPTTAYRYIRYLSAAGTYGDVAEVAFFG